MTRRQLLAAGLSSVQIVRWCATGRLIRVYNAVYAVGHVPIYPLNRAAAAVLACGPGALLSHGSAVAAWGWRTNWPATPEVTTTQDRRPSGILVHRSATLTRADRTRQRGIAITSPARTVLDNAPRLTHAGLMRLYNEARRAGHLCNDALRELLNRLPHVPGARRLNALITDDNPTASHLEDAFQEFVKRYGLPRPQTNVTVAGYQVDVCYPDQRLIVELDSWRFHGDRAAFEADRARDSATTAAGFRTVRVTTERLTQAEADRLAAILGV